MGIGPYGEKGKHPQPPGPAAQSGAFAARVRGRGGDCGRDHPQRGHQPRAIPQSRRSRDSSCCGTQNSLLANVPLSTREPWGMGMRIAVTSTPNFGTKFGWRWLRPRRVGPLGLLAMTKDFCHSEERSDVGIRFFFTMDGGSGRRVVGPYERQGEPHQPPGTAAWMGGLGGNRSRDHPQSVHQLRAIPQSRLRRASSLYTREPFPAGDGGCGLPCRFAPRNDSPDPLSFRGGPTGRRGNPSFFRWTGVWAAVPRA